MRVSRVRHHQRRIGGQCNVITGVGINRISHGQRTGGTEDDQVTAVSVGAISDVHHNDEAKLIAGVSVCRVANNQC